MMETALSLILSYLPAVWFPTPDSPLPNEGLGLLVVMSDCSSTLSEGRVVVAELYKRRTCLYSLVF